MMKYEKNYNNFIPKEQKKEEKYPETFNLKSLQTENHLLIEEKNRLLTVIDNYKQQILDIEEKLKKKDEEIVFFKDSILDLESKIEKYQLLRNDLDKVDMLKAEINLITSKANNLAKENEALYEEIQSYKQHIQTLYLMLLVLAIL